MPLHSARAPRTLAGMPMTFACRACGKRVSVSRKVQGQWGTCPHCKVEAIIPTLPADHVQVAASAEDLRPAPELPVPAPVAPALVPPGIDHAALLDLERQRIALERERLMFEREKFAVERLAAERAALAHLAAPAPAPPPATATQPTPAAPAKPSSARLPRPKTSVRPIPSLVDDVEPANRRVFWAYLFVGVALAFLVLVLAEVATTPAAEIPLVPRVVPPTQPTPPPPAPPEERARDPEPDPATDYARANAQRAAAALQQMRGTIEAVGAEFTSHIAVRRFVELKAELDRLERVADGRLAETMARARSAERFAQPLAALNGMNEARRFAALKDWPKAYETFAIAQSIGLPVTPTLRAERDHWAAEQADYEDWRRRNETDLQRRQRGAAADPPR